MEFECVMGNETMEYVSEEEKVAALQSFSV